MNTCHRTPGRLAHAARRLARLGVTAAASTLPLGCVSFGSDAVREDRINYNEAIADSWKEQLLLNLLRMRYGEAPTFLEVQSVRTEYQLQRRASLFPTFEFDRDGELRLGAEVERMDEPRVSYTPLRGRKFAEHLLAPIAPETVLYLIDAGADAETVLLACVERVNGVRNDADPGSDFRALARALDAHLERGDLEIRVYREGDQAGAALHFAAPRAHPGEFDRLAGLDHKATRFPVTTGSFGGQGLDLAFKTRSLMTVMQEVSQRLEVPAEHLADGRAAPVQVAAADRAPIALLHGPDRPEASFAATRYEGAWHWVATTDMESKRVFSLLGQLMAFQDQPGEGPPAFARESVHGFQRPAVASNQPGE